MNSNIIFATSTSLQRSAIHLHRISGVGCLETLLPLFQTLSQKPLSEGFWKEVGALPVQKYLYVVNPENQEIVDDVMVSFFRGPHSYTGEDVIEISTHGNPLIASLLHSVLRKAGCTEAQPGEFTQRAFLNGKLDLTQAEAVNELIHSDTEGGLKLARSTSQGAITKVTHAIRQKYLEMTAWLEAHIDFAEDEVGEYTPRQLLPAAQELRESLVGLLKTFESGKKIREGVRVAFVGKPNAGKSSLYNALLQENRAIVTEIEGTTRDVLEERFSTQGRDFVLLDTAGLRETIDTVEKIGIHKTKECVEKADIILCLLDANEVYDEASFKGELSKVTQPLNQEILQGKVCLILLTKKDLLPEDKRQQLTSQLREWGVPFQRSECLLIDTHHSLQPVSELLFKWHEFLTHQDKISVHNPILISQRQRDKVESAISDLERAFKLIETQDFPEKISSVLNMSRQSMEEIVGEIGLDDVLDVIFSRFCIGK